MMKNILKELKKIDKKFLIVLLFATIAPVVYSFLRTLWITSDSATSYAMTSFNAYISAFTEIFAVFLVLPIFTYQKQEYKSKSNSLLFAVILATIILMIILLLSNQFTLKQMMILNPDASRSELLTYLRLIAITNALSILETYLIYEIILDKNIYKGIFITIITLVLKIILDFILISNYAIIPFTIINVAWSSLISTIIIVSILLFWYFYHQEKTTSIKRAKIPEMMEFYRRGFYPGLNKLIANFFYVFVTLAILSNLKETEWNAWNLGTSLVWHISFYLANVFKFSLVSEIVNNDQIDKHRLTLAYILLDIIVFVGFAPIYIPLLTPILIQDKSWLSLSMLTSFLMVLPFLTIALAEKLQIRMVYENKFHYVVAGTVISNLLINLPILLALLSGIKFNYLDNYLLSATSNYLVLLIDSFFYYSLLKEENPFIVMKNFINYWKLN